MKPWLTRGKIDSVIYNVDGTMGCCNRMGNQTWKGPQAD